MANYLQLYNIQLVRLFPWTKSLFADFAELVW